MPGLPKPGPSGKPRRWEMVLGLIVFAGVVAGSAWPLYHWHEEALLEAPVRGAGYVQYWDGRLWVTDYAGQSAALQGAVGAALRQAAGRAGAVVEGGPAQVRQQARAEIGNEVVRWSWRPMVVTFPATPAAEPPPPEPAVPQVATVVEAVAEAARRAGGLTRLTVEPGNEGGEQRAPGETRVVLAVSVHAGARAMEVMQLVFQGPGVAAAATRGALWPVPGARRDGPFLAIVIDDWGYAWPAAEAFFRLPIPLTAAVIPGLAHSREQARRARARGWEVLVHLPMEPLDPARRPGPGAILNDLPPPEIRARVRTAIAALPEADGVSNHMGSKSTADPAVMAEVLGEVGAHGLYFLDSATNHASVVFRVAPALGVRWVRNDLFLDGVATVPAIQARLRMAIQRARRQGWAIAIGHVHPATAQAIAGMVEELQRSGVYLVTVSEVVGRVWYNSR